MRATRSTSIRTQTFEGVVLQEMAKEETRHDGSSLSFLHSNSKECGNECHLVSYPRDTQRETTSDQRNEHHVLLTSRQEEEKRERKKRKKPRRAVWPDKKDDPSETKGRKWAEEPSRREHSGRE